MNNYYEDIVEKLGEPKWFDSLGYPRYCEFHPDNISNIYAREVVLLEIACQQCGKKFKVAINNSGYDCRYNKLSWTKEEDCKNLGYGDPPNMQCCGSGPSMISDSLQILEFWRQENLNWIRKPEFEVRLEDYNLYYNE